MNWQYALRRVCGSNSMKLTQNVVLNTDCFNFGFNYDSGTTQKSTQQSVILGFLNEIKLIIFLITVTINVIVR